MIGDQAPDPAAFLITVNGEPIDELYPYVREVTVRLKRGE